MSTVLTIGVVVAVIAGIAAYLLRRAPDFTSRLFSKQPNAGRLQRKYGREYDRLYTVHGDHALVQQQLIGEVLAVRGYPAEDPERQLALASVDHSRSLSEFRDGHDLLQRSNTGAPGVDATEQLRQAMLKFRTFFDDLVGVSGKRAWATAGAGFSPSA